MSNEHDRTIISHGQLDPVPLDQITRALPLAAASFFAALMPATLAGFQLADRLRYANLCAGLAVRAFGGSASAPTLLEVETWYRSAGPHRTEYEFLEEPSSST